MTSDVPTKPHFGKVFTRKRKRSSTSASRDSEFVLPGIRRDEMPKHRSCVVHMLTFEHGQCATRKQAHEIEDEYGTARCFFNGIRHGIRSRKSKRADSVPFPAVGISSDTVLFPATNTSSDHVPFQAADSSDPVLSQETDICSGPVPLQATKMSTSDLVPSQAVNMSSNSFADHLERIWRSFPTDKLVEFTYLECLWFGMYRKAMHKTKVISWIKKKNIFSKNYVLVPICCWRHWNLLILCHFSESLDDRNKKPCMLLLDSLHMAGPMRLEKEIRKFVSDIYKGKGISDRIVSNIPLLVPKVPQQRNKECGFFSLYFIKKFMEAALETISYDDMSFIDKNWFTREELDGFCIALEKESKEQCKHEAPTSQKTGHESIDGDVIVLHDD
ncbi:hypothetical protein V2J09_006860 [Rumex salicifolius]